MVMAAAVTDPAGTATDGLSGSPQAPFFYPRTGVAMRPRDARCTAVAALLVTVLGAAGCQSTAAASQSAASASASPAGRPDPLKHLPWAASIATAAITTDAAPGPMIEADGAIWVVAHRGGILDRIDPATNTVTDQVVVGGELQQPFYLFGSIWIISTVLHQMIRVDPKTRRVSGTYDCQCNGAGIFKYGNLLVGSLDETLALFDPATMKPVRSATVSGNDGEFIGGWAVLGDDIWMTGVGNDDFARIYRVSLTTLKVTLVAPVPALAMENINGRLLTLDATGKLSQIDPTRGSVMASWQLPTPDKHDGSSQLDILDDGTGNGVWVNQLSTQMTHIDLITGQIRAITGLPYQPEVNPTLVTVDGVTWVTDWKDNLVLRLKP
jgi:streptogramin lyase